MKKISSAKAKKTKKVASELKASSSKTRTSRRPSASTNRYRRQISITLTPEQLKLVDIQANKMSVTRAGFINHAIHEKLSRETSKK